MFRKTVFASAAMAMALAPIAAQAAPGDLGTPVARTGAEVGESNELVGTTLWIVGAIVLGLVIWGVIELSDDDSPESP